MKKLFFAASSAALLFFAMTFSSCEKKDSIVTPQVTNSNQIFLSQEILDYDTYIKNRVVPIEWTSADTKQLLVIAYADCQSAWTAFKVVSKIVGAGYGGAAALLAGIGGSLFTWWTQYSETKSIKTQNPNTGVTYPNTNPLIIGELHNNYMHALALDTPTYKATIASTLANKTYDSLVNRISLALNLPVNNIKQDITKTEYTNLLSSSFFSYTGDIDSTYINSVYNTSIQDGYSVAFASYFKEFLNRAANIATFNYLDAISYCDLFITNVDNQQSFTAYEKHYMKSTISIYKNSLKYWKYTIE